jgi:hypothetical protein
MQSFFRHTYFLPTLLLLGTAACTTQEHSNQPQQIANSARILFASDYARDTEFSVNSKNVVGNQCSDFAPVGYAKEIANGTKQPAVSIEQAGKLPVAITAHHHVEKKGLYSSCGPLTRVFVPEANATYVARLVKEKDASGSGEETGLCVLDIKKVSAGTGKQIPVKTMAFGQCT